LEVFVDCILAICMSMDPEESIASLATARRSVPGLQAAYELPEQPDVVVHIDQEPPEATAHRMLHTAG
jgi:adenylylsulfate kinase-like enzyme